MINSALHVSVPLCSLEAARIEMKETDPASRVDDPILLDRLYQIASRIESYVGYAFAPYIGTERYDAGGAHFDRFRRQIDILPVLVITGVTVDETAIAANDDYLPVPRDKTPIIGLRLTASSNATWLSTSGGVETIAVTGIHGYKRGGYAASWRASNETIPVGGISSSAVSWTVSAPASPDAMRQSPRLSAGMMLRVGTEFMLVLEVDYDLNVIYVQRGIRGSTAAAHASGVVIEVWQVEPAIARASARWAGYLYKRRGHYENARTEADGAMIIQMPSDMPDEVRHILDEIRDMTPEAV